MKKIILAVVITLSIFAMGCNKSSGDPKVVLTSFFDALARKDVTTAKKFATKESASMLDMMEKNMPANEAGKTDDEFNKDKMEFGEAKIDGDKATVPVKSKALGEITNFTLKKEDGDWKVAFDKATFMEMAAEKMKQSGMDMNKGMDELKNMTDSMDNMKMDNMTDDNMNMSTDSSNQ